MKAEEQINIQVIVYLYFHKSKVVTIYLPLPIYNTLLIKETIFKFFC